MNPGGLPAFKLAVDGVTFRRSRTVSANDDRAYIDVISGPVVRRRAVRSGSASLLCRGCLLPSAIPFVATTTPQPRSGFADSARCDYADGFLVGSWVLTSH